MKDAKGHGSDGRGGSGNPADAHQHAIARDTVKNPMKGSFLGGPNAAQAEDILRNKFGYTDAKIAALKNMNEPRVGGPGMKGAAVGSKSSDYWSAKSLSDGEAAATLASGPKSAPVETHPAMATVFPRADHPGLGERGGAALTASEQQRNNRLFARNT